MYCMQYCDGYTFCSADQLRPRDILSIPKHESLGDLLCAHFPATPLFFDFRDPRNYGPLYGNDRYTFHHHHRPLFHIVSEEEYSHLMRMDDRILSRLALAGNCMEEANLLSPIARQRLREYVLQMAPAMIATIRNQTAPVPHANIRYTSDILPKLPLKLANELMCRIDDNIHNIPLSDMVMAILWGLLEKTTPRMCMRRCSNKQLAANFECRPVFHLTLEVTMHYGFLGTDPNATCPPSLLTSLAMIAFFRSLQWMKEKEYVSFIEKFEFVIFLSWILYTFEHIDQSEALKHTFMLFPTRARYIAAIRESIRLVHVLIEKHMRPVALDMLLCRNDESVRSAWAALIVELGDMQHEYKTQVCTHVLMRTMEPSFECLSNKVMTQMRTAIRTGRIPPQAMPISMRNEMGNHALLSHDMLKAIELIATFNVGVAAQPIPPLLLLLGVSEEAIHIFTDCVIKFTCRLGAKHAILKDAARWIDQCDLKSVMIIQQYLEFCSIAAGIYLAPLSANVRDNQIAALRRRFQSFDPSKDHLLGRFYYCSGCRVKLTQTVRHPDVKNLLCTSMHDVAHMADYNHYVSFAVQPKENREREKDKSIVRRTRRAGATFRALLLAETGKLVCAGCRADEEELRSWCATEPMCVWLPGNILYLNQKAYTICVQCGSACSYVPSAWSERGPICSVHPPELATVLHKSMAGQFDVLNPTLTAFLNKNNGAQTPAPWMCEITKCRSRCLAQGEVVLLERDGTLRFARLCSDHEETIRILMGGEKRGRFSLRYHTIEQLNEWIFLYCTSDFRKLRHLNLDGTDQYFGPKVK